MSGADGARVAGKEVKVEKFDIDLNIRIDGHVFLGEL